jgi:hypothetical protein
MKPAAQSAGENDAFHTVFIRAEGLEDSKGFVAELERSINM